LPAVKDSAGQHNNDELALLIFLCGFMMACFGFAYLM
jgi:hypothetical protein